MGEEASGRTRSFWLGCGMVMVFCCLNNIFLEYTIELDRGAGPLLTLLQFIFIAAEGLWLHSRWRGGPRLAARVAPLWWYALLTLLFWSLSVINNKAYDYQISQPLHMVFRSSSLASSLLLGFLLFGRRYSWPRVLGVAIVSAGVLLTTAADSLTLSLASTKLQGILMLLAALLLSALLGHLQRWGFTRWGDAPRENMFYQHLLSLVLFVGIAGDLRSHFALWNANPVTWLYVAANVLTQYLCLRGVYLVMAASDPVTMTLTLTIRKFVSLAISVLYFKNAWTSYHWMGTACVFTGALVYGEVWKSTQKEKKA